VRPLTPRVRTPYPSLPRQSYLSPYPSLSPELPLSQSANARSCLLVYAPLKLDLREPMRPCAVPSKARSESNKTSRGREREERQKTGPGPDRLKPSYTSLLSLLSSFRGKADLRYHTLVPQTSYLRRRDSAHTQPPTVSLSSLSLSIYIYVPA
jgi:hypothetical protein